MQVSVGIRIEKMKKFYFQCPKCKNDGSFERISQKTSIIRFALLLLGGFLPALLHGFHRVRIIQCTNCNTIFQQPRLPQSAVSRLSAWLLIIIGFSIAISLIFYFFPQLASKIPDNNYLSIFSHFIRDNHKGISIALLFMFPMIFLLVTFSACVGNYRFRKEFKTKYKIIPEPAGPQKRIESDDTMNAKRNMPGKKDIPGHASN